MTRKRRKNRRKGAARRLGKGARVGGAKEARLPDNSLQLASALEVRSQHCDSLSGTQQMASATEASEKDGLSSYEKAVTTAHRALFILCMVSGVCLALARTPSLVAEKVGSIAGAEVKAQSFPVSSYAVVLGLLVIPILVQWSYRTVTRAVTLRLAVEPSGSMQTNELVNEQLALPLLGSPGAWRASYIARCEIVLVLVVVAVGPIICDCMLLWDYSNQFSFSEDMKAFKGPWGLWFHSPGGGAVRPIAFNNVTSSFHPALLPPWQAWVYLTLVFWAAILIYDMYRCLGILPWHWQAKGQ